jgi:predicted enzyme related to lactoylglutathione lyase
MQLIHLSPILPVVDIDSTLRFYQEVLGFGVLLRSESYGICQRDGGRIQFTKAAEGVMEKVRGHLEIYLEVTDVDSLWAQVEAASGPYRTKPPHDRPYGMREFHLTDPNDCLIFVGQPISRP